jgi:hypothetical protein
VRQAGGRARPRVVVGRVAASAVTAAGREGEEHQEDRRGRGPEPSHPPIVAAPREGRMRLA